MGTPLLDTLVPPACLACDALLDGTEYFCPDCSGELASTPEQRCELCAEPGAFVRRRCPRCAAFPPTFARAFAPFAHEGPVARAIHRLKYEDHPELAAPLASLVARRCAEYLGDAPPVVAPIPLHAERYRSRKFDQAALLAAELARLARRTLKEDALVRTRDTARQVGKSDAEREENVAHAFAAGPHVAQLRVLLVDDVLTTGATARAAARALLDAGAREVWVLTVARATRLTA